MDHLTVSCNGDMVSVGYS